MFFSAPPPSAPRSSTARPPPRNWRLCGALPELGLQMRSKGVLADDSGWSCNIYEYRGDRWRRARPSQEWYFRFENTVDSLITHTPDNPYSPVSHTHSRPPSW
ncbi:hypothetical protein EDB86DRAFT_2829019 [Lactarius hatsudake]|nr:hypothetical protein EDB86DRAFT_2829019 [Lactarius hatsudake]